MRAYTIKHKGANIWQNMCFENTILLEDSTELQRSNLFFRKKDAVKYLSTFRYKEFYEIVGVTFDEIKGDNRKK